LGRFSVGKWGLLTSDRDSQKVGGEESLSDKEHTDKALTLVAGFSRNPSATKQDSRKKSDEEAALSKAITHGQ